MTMRAALERIERLSRGYYWMSTLGIIHACAASALKLPLTEDDRKALT